MGDFVSKGVYFWSKVENVNLSMVAEVNDWGVSTVCILPR